VTRTEAILEAIRTAVYCDLLDSTSAYDQLAAALLIEGAISEWTKAKGADSDDVAALFQRLRAEMGAGSPVLVREEFRSDLGDFTARQGAAPWYEGILDSRVEDDIRGDTRVRPGRVYPVTDDMMAQTMQWTDAMRAATGGEITGATILPPGAHPIHLDFRAGEKKDPLIADGDASPPPSSDADQAEDDAHHVDPAATAGNADPPSAPAVESADLPAGVPADREAVDGREPVVTDSGGNQSLGAVETPAAAPTAKGRRRRPEHAPDPVPDLAYRCASCSYRTQDPALLAGHIGGAHGRSANMVEMTRRSWSR
jgi:hypothetical protein